LIGFVSVALAAELPVRTVILYKHGVGFFERGGSLGPGETARLDFNADEMNDVLKSLTVQERGGGKISGLRYDSMDPLSHKLSEFPFHISDGQPLSGTLDQLKGARVELKFGNETVAGVIAGARLQEANDKQPEREQLTLLLDSGELRTVDLSAATGVRFTDPALQRELKEYFEALEAARSKEKRSVYIDSSDTQRRDVKASYMIPTPVWKSSYRLILAATGKPMLEGWAIVDNTTGEDWNKVELSLVSGRPISFVSQLYPPKYVSRPSADLPDDAAAAPVLNAGAYETAAPAGGGGRGGGRFMAKAPAPPPPSPASRAGVAGGVPGGVLGGVIGGLQVDGSVSDSLATPSTIVANASAGELGELFEYRIGQPVTIRKDESAMLPFLQQEVAARKLLIYSHTGSEHPTNAAEITNSTGKTLDGGPITVYDGGAYAGEALMETLKQNDKRLISYAVDLGTRITEAFDSKAAIVTEIHVQHGMLTAQLAAEESRTYTIRNVDHKAKTLIIEHPIRFGYTLLNQKPIEKTATNSRFEVALAADSSQQFPVNERRVYDQTFQVSGMTPDQIVVYTRNKTFNDAARQQLQRVVDQKNQIAANDRDLRDATTQISSLTSDEDRIRNNIQSLNNVSGQQQQVQNYARQLDAHEQQLATLRDRQSDLQKKKVTLAADLATMLEGLTF
jgi:chaperonin cofactor prefoldin